MPSNAVERRDFLKSAVAAISMPSLVAGIAAAEDGPAPAPSDQITLGCIGLGTHGMGWNLEAFLALPEARVLAVCDVFRERRDKGRDKVNAAYGNQDCTVHTDFREILARKDIDAVVISTPDHWHVLMSVMAAKAGKHVFCEKPTLTVQQGQFLVDFMNRAGVVYQGGIEDRSVEQYYRMAELARNRRLGKLKRILVTLPVGEIFPKEDPAPIPKGLNYDLWLGPAPYTPYTPTKLGPQQWRNVWDYSGGKLTDWGAHLLDTAQVAIFQEQGGPLSVDGKGVFPKDAMTTTATEYEIHYQYPGDVELIVKSGGTGIRIEGADGWVECPAWRQPLQASDPAILETVIAPGESKMWARPTSEHQDFLNGVKKGKTPCYTPEDIHRLSSVMHIGNISMRLGRKLVWDSARETFSDDAEANALLSRPMRAPWSLKAAAT
ncbi:MAG: Gfo/Idh/MocA family oxidoreductase [Candidatus Hydrogenedentes bacterium]|nr:Gfo/Idh/MocA family oxidoreductase [Candidatus Hydrogenedentota bacterium]